MKSFFDWFKNQTFTNPKIYFVWDSEKFISFLDTLGTNEALSIAAMTSQQRVQTLHSHSRCRYIRGEYRYYHV